MELRLLGTQEKDSCKDALFEMLTAADEEFIPPLSARRSTTQADFASADDSADGILPYFQQMCAQQILAALEEDALLGFVSFRENYVCDVIGAEELPNIYISTLIVKPEARGKRLTDQMYGYLFYQLYPDRAIFTRTWSTNLAHIAILHRFGFAQFFRKENDRGPGVDTVYFKKNRYKGGSHHVERL